MSLSVEGSAVPEVGDEVTILAYISYTGAPVSAYGWTLVDADNTKVEFDTNTSGDRITFTPEKAGTYNVTCDATLTSGEVLYASASIQVDSGGKKFLLDLEAVSSIDDSGVGTLVSIAAFSCSRRVRLVLLAITAIFLGMR